MDNQLNQMPEFALIKYQFNVPSVLTPDALAVERKKAVLDVCLKVTKVTNREELAKATEAREYARLLTKWSEESRAKFLAPVKKFVQGVNETVASFNLSVDDELHRITILMEDYNRAEEARVAAENAKAEREAKEALEKANNAKLKLENSEGMSESTIRRRKKEAEETAKLALQAAAAPKAEVTKVSGQVNQKVPEWEVTDLHLLYKHNPLFVRLEANASMIIGALKQLTPGTEVPGLKWKMVTKVFTRK